MPPLAMLKQHVLRLNMAITGAVKDAALSVRLMFRSSAVPADAPRTSGLTILMIDDLVPDPLFGAGYPRAQAIVRSLLAAGHDVHYYPMLTSRGDLARMDAAFDGAVRFHRGEGVSGLRRLLRGQEHGYDLLFVSRPKPMQALIETRRRTTNIGAVPVIYDAEAVLAPREARRRALFGIAWSEAEYRTALHAELGLARDVQAVSAVGRGDADIVAAVIDAPVFVLPHPVTARSDRPGFTGRQDVLFVGRLTGDRVISPNVDSILWFVADVMPKLDAMMGTGYRLHVVGRVEAAAITALASERIVLHGVVEDLQPLYDRSRLFVAPTRYAAGIPLKVVEAMGEGIPCVVTPLLAEQLAVEDGIVAIGNGAEAFASACARLYQDAAAWQTVRDGGIAHVRRACSPTSFDRDLGRMLTQVVEWR